MIAAVCQVHPRPPRQPRPIIPPPTILERAERVAAVARRLSGVLATVLLALLTWLVTSRRGSYILCAVVAFGCYHGHSAYRESVFAGERELLVQAIEAFRAVHGRYPSSLTEAEIVPDQSLYCFSELYGSEPESRGPWLELEQDALLMSTRTWEYDFSRGKWRDYYD